MKYIGYFANIMAMAFIAQSCYEKIDTPLQDDMEYITITTQMEPQVKAGYGGTILPDEFYIDITQNSEEIYKGNVRRDENSSSNRYYFLDGRTPQWKSRNLDNVSIKAISVPRGYNRNTGIMNIGNQNHTNGDDPESAIKASDLLGAKTGDGITLNGNNIIVSFRHLMSKLYIKYSKSSSISISSITLKDVCVKGGYSFADMSYDGDVNLGYGNVDMFHSASDQEAEAIFFPYDANKAPAKPSLEITTSEGKTIPCSISLDKIGGIFEGGKRYTMTIIVSGSSIEGAEVTMVRDWNPDSNSIQVTPERVLWIGTSIPAGNALLNYPMLVDAGMNCTVVNNAVGGSLVSVSTDKAANKTKAEWDDYENANNTGPYSGAHLEYGALCQTHSEIDNTYRSSLMTAYGNNNKYRDSWVTKHLNKLKELSYESLIIPYIDGTLDNCTTVIIDHGYNDLGNMIFLAGAFPTTEGQVRGYDHLIQLKNQEITLDEYQQIIDGNVNTKDKGRNYIQSMAKIINAIQSNSKTKNVRIIIGNYFAFNNPYVTAMFRAEHESHNQFPDYAKFTNLICHYNEAVAGLFDLYIVNVYKYLSIADSMFYNPAHCTAPNDLDHTKFCPDGVHPSHPSAVRAIADIYISQLDGIVGSRGRDNVPTTSSTTASTTLGIDSWDEELDVL